MFDLVRPDYCPYCDTERSVELYDRYDNPLRYTIFLDRFYNGKEKELIKDYVYIRCRKCRINTDTPNMDKDRLPFIPLGNSRHLFFNARYKLDKEEGEKNHGKE